MEDDKRFRVFKNDPKFRRIPQSERKVKIDKRFKSMFEDEKFKVKYTTDKRGRPLNKVSTEDLRRYYDLSSPESSSDEEEGNTSSVEKNVLNIKYPNDKQISEDIKDKLKDLNIDYARGESKLLDESSSDEESEEEQHEEIDHKWGELDNDAEEIEEATNRLAACNMDWDKIRAVDLLVLFNSFLPTGGVIKSVTIYPSEFGKQRMQEEEVKGPLELTEQKVDDEETEEGSKYHMEKLRQYQLNRLKYYYAVIEFDNANTANKVYTECDGMEYESSATKLDLRFIPNDMTFDDQPKEICEKLPELNKYQPRFFTTTALQQIKVDLTWDETDPDRIEFTQKLNSGKLDDISESILETYVAVSSDESEYSEKISESELDDNQDKDPISKYKALLQDIELKENEKKSKEIEMEVSWGVDLKEKSIELVKKKLTQNKEQTPFQKYLDKKKEKRKQKKQEKKKANENNDGERSDSDIPSDIDLSDPYFAEEFNKDEFQIKKKSKQVENNEDNNELQLLLMNDEDDNRNHFSLKKIQEQEQNVIGKNKKKKRENDEDEFQDDFQVNFKDERFSALFTSHLFNIDPTDPHFKKTKGMETFINEKFRRRNDDIPLDTDIKTKKVKTNTVQDPKLNALVKNVKRKSTPLFKIK